MGKIYIWFNPNNKENIKNKNKSKKLEHNLKDIFKKWRIGLEASQKQFSALGYMSKEGSNERLYLSPLLYGCAQLNKPFLLEPIAKRKKEGKKYKGRADCLILIGNKTKYKVLIEAKQIEASLKEEKPRPQILRQLYVVKGQLLSIKGLDFEKLKITRIGICFVKLSFPNDKDEIKELKKYISIFKHNLRKQIFQKSKSEAIKKAVKKVSINFFAFFEGDKKIFMEKAKGNNVYPAIVLVGIYVEPKYEKRT